MEGSVLFSVRLSLQVASVSTMLIMLFGIPLAYVLARRNFRGRELLDMLCTLPFILPRQSPVTILSCSWAETASSAGLSMNGRGGLSCSPGMRPSLHPL